MMPRFFKILAVVLTASLPLISQRSSLAQQSEMSNTVIRGIVRTVSGQPLVGARLFLFDSPSSQYWPNFEEQAEVTTDAKGNFAWRVPKNLERQVLANTNPASSPPACYVLPLEPGLNAKVRLALNYSGRSGTREVLERLVLSCKAQWLHPDKDPLLSVITPERGRVELLLHDPSGKALKKESVNVIVANQFSNYAGALVFEGKTDDVGRLFWQGYSDVRRLSIMVPGVGFGSTGQFALLPDQVVSPRVPALARFAKVSGSVAPALLKAGASVHIEDFFEKERKWYDPQAVVDERGHFLMDGVPPGEHTLVLKGGQGVAKKVTIILGAAEQKSNVVFESAEPAPMASGSPRPSPLPILRRFDVANTTVSGRVTNVAGEGVDNVTIYAICSFDGGLRQVQEILSTKSLPDGSYAIRGLHGSRVALVAANVDSSLALVTAEGPSAPNSAEPKNPELHADLVLPSDHTELTVQVLRNGNPLSDAWVLLSPQSGTGLFDTHYMGTMRSPARDSLQALLTPKLKTNSAGLAKFKDLSPGAWNITALAGSEGELESVGQWMGGRSLKADYAVASGVTLRVGEPKTFALSVVPQPGEIAYHVEGPDGLPPKDPSLSLSFGLAGSFNTSSSTVATVDRAGNGVYSMSHSGLWNITTRFAATSIGNNAEPFYEAGALVAISPALGQQQPIFLHSIKRSAGSIRVQIKDAAGSPTAGSVWIGDSFDSAKFGASTTPTAAAIFSDMPSGSYMLNASAKPWPLPPSLGEKNEPFPNDEVLSRVKQFVPQDVEVKASKESLIVRQPQLLGYVRGKIQVPDAPANYAVYLPSYNASSVRIRYDATSGEFLAGPFSTPDAMIRVTSIKGKLAILDFDSRISGNGSASHD
ncbi:hypothetical protein B1R32_1405 [Abditibacterium utsteinense]|uniref:Carboxypeptidase regulatory-like domain-containing protein n=1 Tax=Abditibacterium utsteinense TaxID=1960156 RepID=A0A2S8SNN2_9BACT|nr:carboxypeptidase-like regulatory domain-containing protein [Abditibacterium utsteinense]PQV62402.1 hypothetical protein B1R32_1405 [Abditibacterium utsteinense]